MPAPFVPEVRQEARLLFAQGLTAREISDRLPVSVTTARRWRAMDRDAALTPTGPTRSRDNLRPSALAPDERERHAARLRSKVDQSGECWEWTASRNAAGYGQFFVGGFKFPAHRWFYELSVGPIPDELVVDHLCGNPPCVRPSHLEPVTQAENVRRAVSWNSAKTHCAAGHAFDEENTFWYKRGGRGCRACHREKSRAWMAAKRAKANPPADALADLAAAVAARADGIMP